MGLCPEPWQNLPPYDPKKPLVFIAPPKKCRKRMKTLGRPPRIWTPGPFSNLRRSSKIIRAVVPWNMAVPWPSMAPHPAGPFLQRPARSRSMGAMANGSLNPPSDGNNHRISAAGGWEASAPETPGRKQRKARGAWLGSMGSGKTTEKMGKMKLDPLDPELPQNSSRQPQYHPAF